MPPKRFDESHAAFDFAALPAHNLRGRPLPPHRGFLAAVLVALLLHGYALTMLPTLMEMESAAVEGEELILTNDDISFDADPFAAYVLDGIEAVSVPCRNEAVAPVPLPPGFAADDPQGGYIDPSVIEIVPTPAEFRGDVGMGGGLERQP